MDRKMINAAVIVKKNAEKKQKMLELAKIADKKIMQATVLIDLIKEEYIKNTPDDLDSSIYYIEEAGLYLEDFIEEFEENIKEFDENIASED